MSADRVISQVFTLLGTAVGGAFIAVFPMLAMIIDAATFVISAILVAWVKVEEVIETAILQQSYWQKVMAGVHYMKTNQVFLLLLVGAIAFNALTIVPTAIIAPYISVILHQDVYFLSLMEMAQTIAMLAGMFAYPWLSTRIKPKSLFVYGGFGTLTLLLMSFLLLPTVSTPLLYVMWVAQFTIFGCGLGVFSNFISIMFVRVVDQAYWARAGALYNAMASGITPIISVLIAWLLKKISILQILMLACGLSVIIFIVFACSKKLNALNQQQGKDL